MKRFLILIFTSGLMLGACCDGDFIIPGNNDNFNGALDVTNLINNCSADAAFTTVGATADRTAASCWNKTEPLNNRWFKFIAPPSTDASIILQVGGNFGTQRRSLIAFYDDEGIELDCSTYEIYQDDAATLTMYNGNLTPGNYYYVSVDTKDAAGKGTFTLCLTDSD